MLRSRSLREDTPRRASCGIRNDPDACRAAGHLRPVRRGWHGKACPESRPGCGAIAAGDQEVAGGAGLDANCWAGADLVVSVALDADDLVVGNLDPQFVPPLAAVQPETVRVELEPTVKGDAAIPPMRANLCACRAMVGRERGIWGLVVWGQRSVVIPGRSAGRWVVGYRPSRVRRWMPRRFWTARSSAPSFFAAQMNAHATTASVNALTAAITIPRKVLTTAA